MKKNLALLLAVLMIVGAIAAAIPLSAAMSGRGLDKYILFGKGVSHAVSERHVAR